MNIKNLLKRIVPIEIRDILLRRNSIKRVLRGHTCPKAIALYKKIQENSENLELDSMSRRTLRQIVTGFLNTPYSPIDCKITNEKELTYGNDQIKFIVDLSYPGMAFEIFADESYRFHNDKYGLDQDRKYTVLDVGANRGYTALWFARKDWCQDVHSFELAPSTCRQAMKNLALNPELSKKIHFHDFGLGKSNGKIPAFVFPHRDGTSSINVNYLKSFVPREMSQTTPVECEVKKASEALKTIVNDSKSAGIILKVDVEGAEYDIFENLAGEYPDIFKKIKFIFGETHPLLNERYGLKRILEILQPHSFECVWQTIPLKNNCIFELVNTTAA
jgi:FkbM family methyltransferase